MFVKRPIASLQTLTANSLIKAKSAALEHPSFSNTLQAAASQGSTNQYAVHQALPAKRYDFSNLTPTQVRETANELFRKGELSLDEAGMLGLSTGTPLNSLDISADNHPVNVLNVIQEAIGNLRTRPLPDSTALPIYENLFLKLTELEGKPQVLNAYA